MAVQEQTPDFELITVKRAEGLGLAPLTIAQSPDTQLRVGDGASSIGYLEWLVAEQERITGDGDRQAAIVQNDKGSVALWVDPAV
jgi:hypothetical protein